MASPVEILSHAARHEQLAEEIVTDKRLLVDLDRRRQGNREALNHLKKAKEGDKSWVNFGDLFVRLPSASAVDYINQDQTRIDDEAESVRKGLHTKVAEYDRMEGSPAKALVSGLQLKPVS